MSQLSYDDVKVLMEMDKNSNYVPVELILGIAAVVAIVWLVVWLKKSNEVFKEEVVVLPAPPIEVKIDIPTMQTKGFHGILDVCDHIVGDGYTVYYGEFRGYACGICDARDAMVVHTSGYYFRGNHFWGADDWYMFAS